MSTQTSNNGKRVETSKSVITLDEIKVGENQKPGTLTAQIRQVHTTKSFYPSKKVDSNLQDSLFGAKDFGFAEQEFNSEENRMAWIPVPMDATKQTVEALLGNASKAGATIYKVLSNEPIIDENQKYAISNGQQTKDGYADKQVVRYPTNEKTTADGTANQLVLDAMGNPQYRRTFFSMTPKEDIDNRGTSEVFLSIAIKAELEGASSLAGQAV